ncbi:MAG TPA: hypothetical protein VK465_17805, partial [Fibrobacteria bacterium]|nr:hypothetical protein [Fibrobacteria bacterium]
VSPTNNRRPTWSWTGLVSEGRSTYRYKLDNSDFRAGATVTSTASFTPAPGAELPEGIHVLYVQQQDSAGNWSTEGSAEVRIDLTAPTAPTVTGPASPTNDDTPTWTWTAGTGGSGAFRYRLDDTTMAGGTETSQLTFTPSTLTSGSHALHVQERDSAGNWSPRGSYSVVIDRTPPSPPTMNVSSPRSPLNSLRPTWSWTSGGGGNGTFQVKVGNDDFSTGATTVTATSYTPPTNLEQGARTLYVRERDAAENWSMAASRTIFLAPRDTLGKRGFSQGGSSIPLILVTSTGVVYTAYLEYDKNFVVVKRYLPGTDTWVDAGIGMDLTWVDDFTLAPGDVPYIVGGSTIGTHVKRLIGPAWQDVGRPEDNAKNLAGNNPSLAISSQGTPYLAFADSASQGQATLWRFSGTDWKLAKSTRIGTETRNLDLAIGANERPYLGFMNGNNLQVYVVTTTLNDYESKWDTLGSAPASSMISPTRLSIKAHSDQVYLGLASSASSADIMVFVSNGGRFTTLLSVKGQEYGSDIDVSPTGVLYLAMIPERGSGPGSGRLAIMGYFGSSWINVGSIFEFEGRIPLPELAVSGDGVPYVCFYDEAAEGKPSVIRASFDPDQ